jgi:pimeloyl-ACP methyl ester carboxylesterase
MPLVAANGHTFHVQELGEGPPVVMLHGLLIGSLASWYFTAAPALSAARRCRLYDLRGHGRSEGVTSGYDVATMTRDLAALTADLAEPFDLVGHSFGAVVALRFALAHPERVRRLVVVEAPLPPASVGELTQFLALPPERMTEALPESLRAAVAGGRRQAERLVKSLSFLVLETSLLADLRAEPDIPDAELARLAVPTLLLYGDRSACLPTGRRLAAAAPRRTHLVVLPGGHYLHLDAPVELTRAIEAHLADEDRIDG